MSEVWSAEVEREQERGCREWAVDSLFRVAAASIVKKMQDDIYGSDPDGSAIEKIVDGCSS